MTQFQSYLEQPDNRVMVQEDLGDLPGLMSEVADLRGDVNHLLQWNSTIFVRVNWYCNKYKTFLIDLSRNYTTAFNTGYVRLRERGYDEWTAKRMTEAQTDLVELATRRDRMQALVNILQFLVEASRDRLPALQSISNNYRAEIREDRASSMTL